VPLIYPHFVLFYTITSVILKRRKNSGWIAKSMKKELNLFPHLSKLPLHEIEEVRQIIEKLHERHITVSLDDFGTGYSTLSYLKQLGIDTLKIDKSFVLDILHDSGDLSIVEASVGLAEAFNAKVLAEGVESVEHGSALIGVGCVLAQGYIIARPMSADLLPKWTKEWRAPQSWQESCKRIVIK
jgi:EAL domain-containing protein (putative c-di-GMP-specific phosphodiesterase class I)